MMYDEYDIVYILLNINFKKNSFVVFFFSDPMEPGHFLRGQTWFAWNLCSGFPIKWVLLDVVAIKTSAQDRPKYRIEMIND